MAERFGGAIDGRQALLGVFSFERNEARQVERPPENRQLAQFRLVKNAEPRDPFVKRLKNNRRFDVAGVVDRIHGGAIPLDVLTPFELDLDTAQKQSDSDAAMAHAIEQRLLSEEDRNQ